VDGWLVAVGADELAKQRLVTSHTAGDAQSLGALQLPVASSRWKRPLPRQEKAFFITQSPASRHMYGLDFVTGGWLVPDAQSASAAQRLGLQ